MQRRARRFWWGWGALGMLGLLPWAAWALGSTAGARGVSDVVVLAALPVLVALAAGLVLALKPSVPLAVLVSPWALQAVVGVHTWLYAAHRGDWRPQPLAGIDPLYVAMGTLSTAGTGDLAAATATARALVTGQIATDVLVTIVVFGLLVARLSDRESPRPRIRDVLNPGPLLEHWIGRVLDEAAATPLEPTLAGSTDDAPPDIPDASSRKWLKVSAGAVVVLVGVLVGRWRLRPLARRLHVGQR